MEKGEFFQWSWNYKVDRSCRNSKKENFEKSPNERNHQISMTSDHFFQAITRLKAIWMLTVLTCSQHCSSCAKHGDSASVSVAKVLWMCKGDMNSTSGENWKEFSSSTISIEGSLNEDSNEDRT